MTNSDDRVHSAAITVNTLVRNRASAVGRLLLAGNTNIGPSWMMQGEELVLRIVCTIIPEGLVKV